MGLTERRSLGSVVCQWEWQREIEIGHPDGEFVSSTPHIKTREGCRHPSEGNMISYL